MWIVLCSGSFLENKRIFEAQHTTFLSYLFYYNLGESGFNATIVEVTGMEHVSDHLLDKSGHLLEHVNIWRYQPHKRHPIPRPDFITLTPYERDGVSNHQPHDCLLNGLFRRRSKKISKLRVTGLCEGNSPGTGEFPAQMASNAENVSIWWRHHVRTMGRILWVWWIDRTIAETTTITTKNTPIHRTDDILTGLYSLDSWCRHQMETFSALLALCAGNSSVTGGWPS